MLDQVIEQHKDSKYFHIGFDEVYYKFEHANCSDNSFINKFMRHLINVATHVRKRLPTTKVIIWDDMLQSFDISAMKRFVILDN
jgi:hypothetical protein